MLSFLIKFLDGFMNEINLEYLSLFLKGELDSNNVITITTGFDITPTKFFKYAEYDLTTKYDHYLINSLSNTKRAIDCQLDSLFIAFGLDEKSKDWHFPTKINYLNSIGIISPRILKKINKRRNLLEHEYKYPNEEEVEDALDVAELFIRYTNKYLLRAHSEIDLYYDLEEETYFLSAKLDWENKKLCFETRKRIDKEELNKEISASQKEYDDYLKMFIKLCDYFLYGTESEE